MTLHLVIHPVSEWLGWITLGFVVAGPVGMFLARDWELGAIAPLCICWAIALVVFILFVGSLL